MTLYPLTIHPIDTLRGTLTVPGDKSISHRAILASCFAVGPSRLINLNAGMDVRATLAAVEALGVQLLPEVGNECFLHSPGLEGLRTPEGPIDCGNSGTTARLLTGLAAGLAGRQVTLTGDASLTRRPMERVIAPLRAMGASIEAADGHLPLTIQGQQLQGIDFTAPTPSAQVKSALILAAAQAATPSTLRESLITRDHTERLWHWLSLQNPEQVPWLERRPLGDGGGESLDLAAGQQLTVHPITGSLRPLVLQIPGDASAAAFWLTAAVLHPNAALTIEGVGLNPTRLGFLELLAPGGTLTRTITPSELHGLERVGQLAASTATLPPVRLGGPGELAAALLIDELPLAALVATQCTGTSVIQGAGELRVKESDRLLRTAELLNRLGADVQVTDTGWIIHGPTPLQGGTVQTHGDHRLAMLAAIAALSAAAPVTIDDGGCIAVSDPTFLSVLATLDALGDAPVC